MSSFLTAVALFQAVAFALHGTSVIASPKGEATSRRLLRFARSDVGHCPFKTETTPLSSHTVWDSFDRRLIQYSPPAEDSQGRFTYDLGFVHQERTLVETFNCWGYLIRSRIVVQTSEKHFKHFEEPEDGGNEITISRRIRQFLKGASG